MDCKNVDELIMKFLDGDINEAEAAEINEHISLCEACRESFYIYDSLQVQFDHLPEICAPEGFETQVMAKITALDEDSARVQYGLKDKIGGFIWGSFTILFGTGAMLALYRRPILNSMLQSEFFAPYAMKLLPVESSISQYAETLKSSVVQVTSMTNEVLTNSVSIILGLIAVICAVQFVVLRKRKTTNKADDK